MQFLNNDHLWQEIKKQAGKSKSLHAAVGYIGRNPLLVIKWPKNSVVIADLSENAIRSGASSARGGLSLLKKGVKLYQLQFLHAKIYVFDKSAIVCSANLSESSARLYESGVLITEDKKVREIRSYVRALINANKNSFKLEKDILKSRIKLEPKHTPMNPPDTPPNPPLLAKRVWLLPCKPDENEPKEVEKAKKAFIKKEHENDPRIEWYSRCDKKTQNGAEENDSVMLFWKGTKHEVFGKIEGPCKLVAGVDFGKKYKSRRYNLAFRRNKTKIMSLDKNGFKTIQRYQGDQKKRENALKTSTRIKLLTGLKRNRFGKWFAKLISSKQNV